MNREQVEQRAEELFQGGLHCAEAVLAAVLEGQGQGQNVTGVSPRAASAFGGGVGRSKKALCGALSGGLIALGLLQGRDTPDEKWDAVAVAAEAVRSRFEAGYGCTTCGEVLERLGPQEGMDKCIRLAANTASLFHDALNNPASTGAAAACGCTARQAATTTATTTATTAAAKPSGCGCGCG
ncbi:MAG: oxidoreductase [Desulfovibrionales bacterium GWA2_65_9]|nr:MAG: oxidoreductase [Desulfovibrionales bacterium GWA2_65_9]